MSIQAVSTGIDGLNRILGGGYPQGSVIIAEGAPGTGKTTLGMQFLFEGATEREEPGIYVSFEEFPSQLYADADKFGWDLKALEKRNLLRIISVTPELLLEQMSNPDGFFEQSLKELQCKRLVIDSIGLLKYASRNETQARSQLYTLRNIVRKFAVTTILIREVLSVDREPFAMENYLADGVIRLSLKPHLEKYRKRTLEVQKMRGMRIVEGEHNFKFMDHGIHLVPILSMAQDKLFYREEQFLSTGIRDLDRLLGGGLPGGSVFLLDTNSKANNQYLIGSIIAERLRSGDYAICSLSSTKTIHTMQRLCHLFGVSLDDAVHEGRAYFVEHYDRTIPDGMEKAVLRVSEMSNLEYKKNIETTLGLLLRSAESRGRQLFAFQNLNNFFTMRGKEFVQKYLSVITAKAQMSGMTVLAHCNFTEIHPEIASYLERSCNGVIKTWVDGNYQYLQITKSPAGRMSAPYMIESVAESPFIRLV